MPATAAAPPGSIGPVSGWIQARSGPTPEALRQNRYLLTLLTCESTALPVDFNERTEMLRDAGRWIPTQVLNVDDHGSWAVELCLKSLCHVGGFFLEWIAITKSAENGEEDVYCHW